VLFRDALLMIADPTASVAYAIISLLLSMEWSIRVVNFLPVVTRLFGRGISKLLDGYFCSFSSAS